ncbi:MAG TPA: [LysW]-aminoadipate kinase [Candidatus Thermoplasmatota archaeon]|nr:[LysW]-aminoadipate kinase [Candidatus Thermoplasmatota archaeon]
MLVVKLGGGKDLDPEPLLRDLAALQEPWVLVHGGNAELDDLTRRLGAEPRFVTSPSGHTSRVTDANTINLIQMSYRGRINNDLVLRLQRLGCNAVGLSGIDGRLLQAERKEAIRVVEGGRKFLLRDDLTGRVRTVNAALLRLLLDNGYRPVVTIPALAATGEAVNVDGDRAAAAIAAALGAHTLVVLSNVPGLLRDLNDPGSLIRTVSRDDLEGASSFAQGRFKKKVLGAREALEAGIPRVILGSAHGERPLQAALAGQGTVLT